MKDYVQPASLEEAINLMKANPMVREVLGEHTFHQYISGKKAEWDLYRTRVSQWEIEKYLVMY
jgi:glutamine synthetase